MIKVKLKCKCTDGETEISIRGREDGEDIRDYMRAVQDEVSKWHRHRLCSATKLEYLKLPIVEGKGIGEE